MVPRLLTALLLAAAAVLAPASAPASADVPHTPTRGEINVDAATGWALFKRPWISAPSSLAGGGGLGPMYDARSCDGCHAGGAAGRVAEDTLGFGLILRVGRGDAGGDPVYGRQLQTHALPGFEPEADVTFHWQGAPRVPKVDVSAFHYGEPEAGTHIALRRAPSLLGIGKLEQVPESEILKGSGRPAWLTSADGTRELGRWGWKAVTAGLPRQVEIAFQRDFGIGTSGLPGPNGECTEAEKACHGAPGDKVELPDNFRDNILVYLRYFHSPEKRNEAGPGFALFRETGCLACHAVLKDKMSKDVHAYTDMMLHDMGPGLDDGIAEGAAKSSEWRTAPLWDLPHSLGEGGLLHDGRARDIAEAVSWHGGEASQARVAFNSLSPRKRKLIEDFLLGR